MWCSTAILTSVADSTTSTAASYYFEAFVYISYPRTPTVTITSMPPTSVTIMGKTPHISTTTMLAFSFPIKEDKETLGDTTY